ncbi:MAG: site-2 protease family protein [Pseudomonadota bacterium]
MEELNSVQKIAIWVLPLVFAITVHEVAHGWVAKRLGDPTAMMLGRLTLNPIKHIDPMGTLIIPGLLLWLGGFVFGWAKPVPVTWENLRHPRRDMAWVALAGPVANLLMAILWAGVMRIGIAVYDSSAWLSVPLFHMGDAGIKINLLLMLLNLLPIPPLDGGRILGALLPGPASYRLSRLEPYGFFILLFLMMTHVLNWVMTPPLEALTAILYVVAGL